ncbi:MAG: TPM domain-containing protein, partial [Duncaniella sp.]|nr:TPM domain-containing protein [Duncaniella sp.]
MKRNILLLMAMVLAMVAGAITVDQVPNVHVADRYEYVSNPSGILTAEAVRRLNDTIRSVWDETSVELVVVVVDKVDPSMTPAEFATKLFEKWGIGKKDKDNGVLMLVSRDDRAAEIRTGYGV